MTGGVGIPLDGEDEVAQVVLAGLLQAHIVLLHRAAVGAVFGEGEEALEGAWDGIVAHGLVSFLRCGLVGGGCVAGIPRLKDVGGIAPADVGIVPGVAGIPGQRLHRAVGCRWCWGVKNRPARSCSPCRTPQIRRAAPRSRYRPPKIRRAPCRSPCRVPQDRRAMPCSPRTPAKIRPAACRTSCSTPSNAPTQAGTGCGAPPVRPSSHGLSQKPAVIPVAIPGTSLACT